MAQRPDVFISATTSDLGSYRLAVRDTLLSLGLHPVLQDHFPPDYRDLIKVLHSSILPCDAVICLVGFVYGSKPRNQPEGSLLRSYTQMEYDIARELKKTRVPVSGQ
jgi:hypothetical protein